MLLERHATAARRRVVCGHQGAGAVPARRAGDGKGADRRPLAAGEQPGSADGDRLDHLLRSACRALVHHVAERGVASHRHLVQREGEPGPRLPEAVASGRHVEHEDVERDVPDLNGGVGPGAAAVHTFAAEEEEPRDDGDVVVASLSRAEHHVVRQVLRDALDEPLVVSPEHDHVDIVIPGDPRLAPNRTEQGPRGEEVLDAHPVAGRGEGAQEVFTHGVGRLEVLIDVGVPELHVAPLVRQPLLQRRLRRGSGCVP